MPIIKVAHNRLFQGRNLFRVKYNNLQKSNITININIDSNINISMNINNIVVLGTKTVIANKTKFEKRRIRRCTQNWNTATDIHVVLHRMKPPGEKGEQDSRPRRLAPRDPIGSSIQRATTCGRQGKREAREVATGTAIHKLPRGGQEDSQWMHFYCFHFLYEQS